MEPKFQSSFIPKGPTASAGAMPGAPVRRERSILSFVANIIFALSVIAAVGVFGYKFYLNYSIESMAAELEAGKANLEQETVDEIRRLNNRILATEDLLDGHLVLTPLFNFLEASTLRNVRFTEFDYISNEKGLEVIMKGESRGYSALALQAEIFQKNKDFLNPLFSDLTLDDEGNVVFTFRSQVSSTMLSYERELERTGQPEIVAPAPSATSTATSTPSGAAPSSGAGAQATTTRN